MGMVFDLIIWVFDAWGLGYLDGEALFRMRTRTRWCSNGADIGECRADISRFLRCVSE